MPRQALSRALQAAGVEPALHDLVLDLHEHCQYEISQNGFTGKFDMQCGVRQGCSLSPLLYAIFTGWLYDVIKDRTDARWAQDFITMYADDTVLQWQVRGVQDLHFMCKCVQQTFRALREVGMSVNSSKSKIVIKLQGPQAKAWLRKHLSRTPQGPVLRLGTPCNPIDIPRVHSLTYLGVEASLSSFEMQTCALRLRMSAQIKHRLIKVLHAAKLGLHHRVRLYQACLRSSMLYGQHAVGITTAVLRRLEAADARHLRGVARSPAHLTHESSVHLRQRLRISSPQQALQQLLQRRATNSRDGPSRERFKVLLAWLRDQPPMDVHDPSKLLQPVDSHRHIACDICGQYFGSMQHLMSHHARKHPEAEFPAAPGAYYEHTVDGMPECRHCGAKFSRVAAMRKHLKGACPVLYAKRTETTNTVLTGEVPLKNAELLTGHTCRAPTDGSSETPLVQNPEYCALARAEWKQALRRPHLVQSLRTHCAVCRQWISMQGPGAKQHYRLAHPDLWKLKAEAVSRCKGLGFAYTRPCCYCNQDFKDPRAHVPRCGAVFQASITSLWLSQDHGGQRGCGDGRSRSPGVCRGDGSGAGAAKPDDSHPTQAGGGQGQRGGSAIQVPPTARRGQQGSRTEERKGELGPQQLGQCKLESFFRLGRPGGTGEQASKRARLRDPSSAALDDQIGHPSRRRTCPAPSGHVVDAVCRHPRRGNSATPSESGGAMADQVRGTGGDHGTTCGPLPGPGQRGQATPGADVGAGAAATGHQCRLDGPGLNSADSRLALPRLESGTDAAGAIGAPAIVPPDCPAASTDASGLQCLSQRPHPLQGDSRTGGGAHQPGGPVHAVPFTSERGHSPLSSSPRRPGWKRVPEALRNTPTARKRPAISTMPGAGGPLPQALLHGLDGETQSAGAEEIHPAPHGAGDGRAVNQAACRVTCQVSHQPPQVPQAKLQNPHSLCYMNSIAQSLAWQGRLSSDPLLCYGQANFALQMVLRPGTPTLHRSLPWLPYVQTWQRVAQQHDASEYLQHFLSIAQPPAYSGRWEARMSNPHQVTDGGELQSPLLLEARGPDLQTAVDAWHAQPALHALHMHTGLVPLQLKRYSYEDGSSCKNQTSILCRPGAVIRVPCFAASTGLQIRHDRFRIAFVIFHVGERTHSGHYQAALSCPTAVVPTAGHAGPTEWIFQICQDRCKPKPATTRDQTLIRHNGYLVGLICIES